jgi:sugar/nucleoside kinase (ribokinase family)
MIPPRLVCLGQFTIDDIVQWDGTVHMGCVGGDAVFSWFGAHLWVDDVGVVGPVGDDFPIPELQTLRDASEGFDGIGQRSAPTIRNWVLHERDGRRTWVLRTDPTLNYELSPRYSDIPAAYRGARAFLIAAMDMGAQDELASLLRRSDVLLSLDPEENYIRGNEKRFAELLAKIDVFLPSAIEAQQLVGHADYERALRELAAIGPTIVAIKLGAEGAIVYERSTDLAVHVAAYPARFVDGTGAGDAFCGGFMAGLACHLSPRAAALWATVAASFAVEAVGWLPLLTITRAEAEQRLDRYKGDRGKTPVDTGGRDHNAPAV